MPVLRGESQVFPQKRVSSPCNTLFKIVFFLKSIFPKRFDAVIFFFKLCYEIRSLLFEVTVNGNCSKRNFDD